MSEGHPPAVLKPEKGSQTMFTFNEGHSGVLLATFGDLFQPYAHATTGERYSITLPISDLVTIARGQPETIPVVIHKMGEELGQFQFRTYYATYLEYKEYYTILNSGGKIEPLSHRDAISETGYGGIKSEGFSGTKEDALRLAREQIEMGLRLHDKAREKIEAITEFYQLAGDVISEARHANITTEALDPQWKIRVPISMSLAVAHLDAKREQLGSILEGAQRIPAINLKEQYQAALTELDQL